MPPYGGPTTHGFEYTEEGAAETSRFFASGEASFESQRQHGKVGGLPDQGLVAASNPGLASMIDEAGRRAKTADRLHSRSAAVDSPSPKG